MHSTKLARPLVAFRVAVDVSFVAGPSGVRLQRTAVNELHALCYLSSV